MTSRSDLQIPTRPTCMRCGEQSTVAGDWGECFTVCDECWNDGPLTPEQLEPVGCLCGWSIAPEKSARHAPGCPVALRVAPAGDAARLADELEVARGRLREVDGAGCPRMDASTLALFLTGLDERLAAATRLLRATANPPTGAA